jgi:hypothetical protein
MKTILKSEKARLDLIQRNRHLFWYVPEEEKQNISLEALVEAILNYGDLDAVSLLFNQVGITVVASIFFKQINQERVNYFPQVINFFTLYFNRYAQGSIDKDPA